MSPSLKRNKIVMSPSLKGNNCIIVHVNADNIIDWDTKHTNKSKIVTSDKFLTTKKEHYYLPIYKSNFCISFMSRVIRKPDFAYQKTKPLISCAVTAQLISTFVFASSSSYIRNFKLLAIFCCCTGLCMSDLFVKPDTRFFASGLICFIILRLIWENQ